MRHLAVLLAILLTACGDDSAPEIEVPSWAQVAPEQTAEATKHGVPVAFENDLGMRFVLIPAGTFTMGSPSPEKERWEDEIQHEVTISRPFYMQITEVTNGQYRRKDPGHDSGAHKGHTLNEERQPVVQVSWNDASAFAMWTSQQDDVRAYRLPTEAEWEYACRAGTWTPFWCGETISTDQANYDGHYIYALGEKGAYRQQTTHVGAFDANPWGLVDVHGNVWEWCQDRAAWYRSRHVVDPIGALTGSARALRGGSWNHGPRSSRSAHRAMASPQDQGDTVGFRLVSPLPEPGE